MGRWGAPKAQSQEIKRMLSCPDCREPITGVFRYGRIINKGLVDNMTCKFQVAGEQVLSVLRNDFQRWQLSEDKKNATLADIEQKAKDLLNLKHPLQKIYEAAHSKAARASTPFFNDILLPDHSVHTACSLLLIKCKLSRLGIDKNRMLTSGAAISKISQTSQDDCKRWKKIVLYFNVEKDVKTLITLMKLHHMLASTRDVLFVAAPGVLEIVDCCVRAMRGARGKLTSTITDGQMRAHAEVTTFFTEQGQRSLSFAKDLQAHMSVIVQLQQQYLELAGAIVRNTRVLMISSLACLSDQLQAATPHTQRSIKQKQHERLETLHACLQEYERRHRLDEYSGKLSSEVIQCADTFRCLERHNAWRVSYVWCRLCVCLTMYCSLAGLAADEKGNDYNFQAGLLFTGICSFSVC